MINTLRISSRSVSNDIVFERIKHTEMNHHKQRLQQIKRAPLNSYENTQRKQRLKQLKKSKKASHKIDEMFDPVKLQNKAMVDHITTINRRRSIHDATSLKNLHTYRSYKQQEQKNQIKKQNIKLITRILEEKAKITTKKELKQQFKEYQTKRDKLRKVHSKSHI